MLQKLRLWLCRRLLPRGWRLAPPDWDYECPETGKKYRFVESAFAILPDDDGEGYGYIQLSGGEPDHACCLRDESGTLE